MHMTLWCPECQKSQDPHWFYQRCDDCGGLLEDPDETLEIDYKELGAGYEPEEQIEEETEEDTDDEAEDDSEADGESEGDD
ncbi:hypothetical protein ACVWZV_002240 [Bradyrhizobium sp. GM5.1]